MTLSVVLGAVAAAAVAALVIMVGVAGGWRGDPRPASSDAGQERSRTPQQAAFTLRWRATWVTEVIRVSLLAVIGLTPAGVAFMQLLAPSGDWLPVAAALMIMAAVLAAAGLPGRPCAARRDRSSPASTPGARTAGSGCGSRPSPGCSTRSR